MNVAIQPTFSGPKPSPNLWFFKLYGLERGPVTWEVLQDLARSGDLKPSDLVRRDGDDRWVVATRARAHDPARDSAADSPVPVQMQVPAPMAVIPASIRRPSDETPPSEPASGHTAGHREPADPGPAEPNPVPVSPSPTVAAPVPPAARPSASEAAAGRPAGTALLALGLALVGVFKLALPLGLLSIYLGGRSARALGRRPAAGGGGGAFAAAAAAVLVGLLDVGVSLYVIGGRLADLRAQFAVGD